MPRVKRGTRGVARRKKVLAHTKGFKWRRKNVYKIAVDAMRHALVRSYQGRKQKKRRSRVLWQTNINAAVRIHGTTYSKFTGNLKKHNIALDRKVLSQIAQQNPETFKKIVDKANALRKESTTKAKMSVKAKAEIKTTTQKKEK